MTWRAIHISDLHRGKRESLEVDEALVALVDRLAPEVVIVTGDQSNRGRRDQLERAHALLARLSAPFLAVPGNHDLPYSFPGRFVAPAREFDRVFGTTNPVFRSDAVVVCGLNSACPWRHQGGRLSQSSLGLATDELANAPQTALRVVALHHHLAGAPWRSARKFPLKGRSRVLETLRGAGAELILSGHIHQSTTLRRSDFAVTEGGGQVVLSTAPGFGRPRPGRLGEAHGLHVIEWDDETLKIDVRLWDPRAGEFAHAGLRVFDRIQV